MEQAAGGVVTEKAALVALLEFQVHEPPLMVSSPVPLAASPDMLW